MESPGLADQRFTFAYLFAAAEPGTDNAFVLVLPEVNTLAMQEFLDQFSFLAGLAGASSPRREAEQSINPD